MNNTISLRNAVESDMPCFWEFCSNEEVSRYLTWKKYEDYDTAKAFFDSKIMTHRDFPNLYLMILLDETVIGNVHIIERENSALQIGIGILPQYWNKGYGTQTLMKVEDYIRSHLEDADVELWADIHQNNDAMRKVLIRNGYYYLKRIDNNRCAFRKIITGKAEFNYLNWLKNSEAVDAVISIGSMSDDALSDIDILVVCYEENTIEQVMTKTRYIEGLTFFEETCPNHCFFAFNHGKVFDVYFVSIAFVNAMFHAKQSIFDKSTLISLVFGLPSSINLKDMVSLFINNLSKLVYKTKEGKYIQATRVLADIRDRSIIPLGNYAGVLTSKNIIDLHWNEKSNIFYEAFLQTYVPPFFENLKEAINKNICLMRKIISMYKLSGFDEIKQKIEKCAAELYGNNTILDLLYKDKSKLKTRIGVWKTYATATQGYTEFLLSILGNKIYDGYADLGCGDAFYSSQFLNNISGEAYFCDFSKSLITEAEKKIRGIRSKNVNFLCTDIIKAEIPNGCCALISLMHVLHHIENMDAVFNKVRQIAKDESDILITTFDHSLKDFLNEKHYEALEKFSFPLYMRDKAQYLKFSGDKAYNRLCHSFPDCDIQRFEYRNDALVNDANVLFDYYQSAMMFRLSNGFSSKDITKDQWADLAAFMKNSIEEELKIHQAIRLEGGLVAFMIHLS